MPCKSCGSINQREFIGGGYPLSRTEKLLISPSRGYFQRLLSVWIVGTPNLLCQKRNCAFLRKPTPLRQGNLELSLTISLRNKRLNVLHTCFGTRARLPGHERR